MKGIITVIFLCIFNIICSLVLNLYFKEKACVSCYLLIFFFIVILFVSIIYVHQKKHKVFFFIVNGIFSILGCYVVLNKLAFYKKKYIFNIQSCTGGLDGFLNIKNIIRFFFEGAADCKLEKLFFLGIQIEYYILISFFIISIISINNILNR